MSDGVNLNVAATPIDADAEMEEDDEWQTVRAKSKKKKVLMKFKRDTFFRKNGELERRQCFHAIS